MAYRHHPGVFDPKFHTNAQRRDLEDLLGEWYGDDFAATEITAQTDEPRKFSEILDSLLEDKLNTSAMQQLELRENWESMIGPPLNKITRFVTVKEDSAVIEVAHPAFLMELQRSNSAELWSRKLQQKFPDLGIKKIVFVPKGQ